MRRVIWFFMIGLFFSGLVSCNSLQGYINLSGSVDESTQPTAEEVGNPSTFPIPATPPQQTPVLMPPNQEIPEEGWSGPIIDEETEAALLSQESFGFVIFAQPGSPVGIPNFAHPGVGCNWMGVGGQVFGIDGWPVTQMVIELGGTLGGQAVSALALTGSAVQWGPGGYEFTLADRPVASENSLWIKVYNLEGRQLSPRIPFSTFTECERNTILLNMIQLDEIPDDYITYLPILTKEGKIQ